MLITSRTSRLLATSALLLAAPALAACSTELATDKIYTPAVGDNARSESVDVLNAVVVANEGKPGEGTVVVTLVNNEVEQPGDAAGSADDELTGLVVKGGEAEFGKPVTITAGRSVLLADPAGLPEGTNPSFPIRITGDFTLGEHVELTFQFANSGDVKVSAPVVHNVEGSQFQCQNGPVDPAPAQAGEAVHEGGHAEGHHAEPEDAKGAAPECDFVAAEGEDTPVEGEVTEETEHEAGH